MPYRGCDKDETELTSSCQRALYGIVLQLYNAVFTQLTCFYSQNLFEGVINMSNNQIPYFNAVNKDSLIYSVDNVKIIFNITKEFLHEIKHSPAEVSLFKGCEYKRWHKGYYYKYIKYLENGAKMNISISNRHEKYQCSILCNPNKCFKDTRSIEFIKELLKRSTEYYISKLDIAVDIPVKYSLLEFDKSYAAKHTYQKNKGSYPMIFWGERNKKGYVRVYDKSDEAKLDYDVTRVEMTIGNPYGKNDTYRFPSVWSHDNLNKADIPDNLSSTDISLIRLIVNNNDGLDEFNKLAYNKRKKLEPYISKQLNKIVIDTDVVRAVAYKMYDIIELPSSVYCDYNVKVIPESDDTK